MTSSVRLSKVSMTDTPWHGFSGQVSQKLGQLPQKLGHLSQNLGQLSQATPRIVAYLEEIEPVKTAEAVASVTPLSADTFRKWKSGRSGIGGPALLALVGAYGLDVLVAAYGPERLPRWLDAAVADAERRDIAALAAAIESQLAQLDHA